MKIRKEMQESLERLLHKLALFQGLFQDSEWVKTLQKIVNAVAVQNRRWKQNHENRNQTSSEMPHSAYSPALAPSDNWLFSDMKKLEFQKLSLCLALGSSISQTSGYKA